MFSHISASSGLEDGSERILRSISHIASQRKLHRTRQLERLLLQESSQQTSFECQTLNPTVKKQLLLKRSAAFFKSRKLSPDHLYDYRNWSNKQLKVLLTPAAVSYTHLTLPTICSV
eukprot:TRINITY_DN19297_c0_g1_i1.p1 TRINITY_DN19297_c0_g1~~TRINITY_DN19297_c0_g1_i1.p1  ORF type:complete len:117 (-),score=4.88 TRINITY_DN19297_c0_g1_i1:18-368(-)